MSCSDAAQVYKPRNPRDSSLWQLLDEHFDEFEERYDNLFSKEYGFYRPVVSLIVRKFLKCGDLHQGFARVRCPDCHYEYLLAFSCHGRYFCPSFHAKKEVQFSPTFPGECAAPRTTSAVCFQHLQDAPPLFPL